MNFKNKIDEDVMDTLWRSIYDHISNSIKKNVTKDTYRHVMDNLWTHIEASIGRLNSIYVREKLREYDLTTQGTLLP